MPAGTSGDPDRVRAPARWPLGFHPERTGSLRYCTNCGHEIVAGRFCTECGQAVDQTPPAARYPLYADQVPPEPEPVVLAPAPTARPGRAWWPWVAVLAAVVLVAALAMIALEWAEGDGQRPPSASAGSGTPAGSAAAGELAGTASATVPETAPPNQDTSGNPTTYEAANLLDGSPQTCWRMPGDGTGSEIVVTLPEETDLEQVGMVNGYAKSAGDLDWYEGNRRVLRAEWVFDDGTSVEQRLTGTRDLQTIDVDVTTSTVVVRLTEVSEPGTGPSARDYTAISELSIVGG